MGRTENNKLFFPELSFLITGACFNVQNEIGRWAREKQYCDLLEKKLAEKNISFQREFKIKKTGNVVDFIVENNIILEIKAKRLIERKDYFQVQRYLQASKIKLGLLINFRNYQLKPKRIVRIETISAYRYL